MVYSRKMYIQHKSL